MESASPQDRLNYVRKQLESDIHLGPEELKQLTEILDGAESEDELLSEEIAHCQMVLENLRENHQEVIRIFESHQWNHLDVKYRWDLYFLFGLALSVTEEFKKSLLHFYKALRYVNDSYREEKNTLYNWLFREIVYCNIRQGDFNTAQNYLEQRLQYINTNSDKAGYYLSRSYIQVHKSKPDDAIQDMLSAVRLSKDAWGKEEQLNCWVIYADHLLKMEFVRMAYRVYMKLIKYFPKSAEMFGELNFRARLARKLKFRDFILHHLPKKGLEKEIEKELVEFISKNACIWQTKS